MPRRVPAIPQVSPGNHDEVLRKLSDVIRFITAESRGNIQPLDTTATTAQIIEKVNEIIARLQGTA